MSLVDSLTAIVPQPVPSRRALERCKIISHRGEHDNCTVMENTLDAFEAARTAGVWGIEGDIRFTQDLVPVICHDACCTRVFGITTPIGEQTYAQLRKNSPQVPSLEEVIDKFGGNTHLMLEVKDEPWPQLQKQRDILNNLLTPLEPIADYHILALDPELFARLDFVPTKAFFPVAEVNVPSLSRIALERGYGGLGGHYLLLGNRLHKRHKAQGQRLGTGFPRSKNALFRELNRDIEWIFSNDAIALQAILDDHLTLSTPLTESR